MDNTTLTIIGMIAAFLSASITPILTSTVTNHLQHRRKLQALRVALYKEIWNNYDILEEWNGETYQFFGHQGFRTECYKNALQNDLALFYELDEANLINYLQGMLMEKVAGAVDPAKHVSTFDDEELENASVLLETTGYRLAYLSMFSAAFYKNEWSRKILKRIVPKVDYQNVIVRGEKAEQMFPSA